MGLRYASVRQPIAVVMAPALTETSQPQGFSLKSDSLSSPVSLVPFDENTEGINTNIKCLKRLTFLDSNTTVVMNGDSENISDLKSVSDSIPQDQLCKGKSRPRPSLTKPSEECDQAVVKESDYSLLQIGGFMMNSSCSNEADVDKMGLQKSGSNIEPCNYLKMDLFKTIGNNTSPQGDLGAAGDIGHNVDEIMQVIKNMESKTSDIEETLEPSLHINDGPDIAGGLSNFEREFFNDVDMINMCEEENLGENGLPAVNKDTTIKVKGKETVDRQFTIHRKCDWIKRRLYKLQMRAMGKHVSEEITSTLHHLNDVLNADKTSNLYSALTSGKADKEKGIEINNFNLSSLTRRLEHSSQQQTLAASQNHVPSKYFGSGHSDNSPVNIMSRQSQPLSGSVLPKLDSEVYEEMKNKAGELCYQLKVTEISMDSDVTASSSGGESCDEMQCFSNLQQQSLSITKRASWRWSQDRATIASKWTWLQAQISDLEYRIRQTNELNKKIRTGKGGVILEGEDPPRLCDSVVVNGYHGTLPGATGKIIDDEPVTVSSCRTRPLKRTSFLKRKVLRTAGLHLTSKKAAKQSTIHCGCQPPLPSCALCTGRTNPTQPREDLDLLTLNERIAMVDPAFHPVLSFPNDVSQSVHFDAIMKTSDWQLKAQRLQPKTITRTIDNSDDSAPSEKRPLLEQQRRRYLKRSTGATALTERLSCSEDKGEETRHEDEDSNPDSYMMLGGTHSSPIPSPSPSSHCSKERDAFRRKRENSYDIDNIVIPYSVAAATRLEKLQYKEILTPKWRLLPVEQPAKLDLKNNGLVRRLSKEEEETTAAAAAEEDEAEDLTEEGLISRHEKCEQEERKKFSTYLKLPNSMARSRSHRRADSRAESSGGNTPDPMSPVAADGGGSPMTSPPATPQPADCDVSQIRRRTLSRCVSPVDIQHDEVAPYELRTFPLTDEIYEKMLKVMPPGHPFKAYSSSHPNYLRDSESESRPVTPVSDSTESADTFVEEDPNDPEWTVGESSVERVPFKR
ncbi:KAT8 regulatory NSL complex subunit 1 isoform X2 [Macrosteles quadrilineatus]|uniref:KAT8 regulatory NSL complex subunit 1 isoform X2 n=1 Tax=Macrosteles quadrilineatus TaxID=74068 RepID=UPI0023E31025|nr:KAT8 regulatory NSL complex subunit 1 isoform X2 [Macrosteles quadrilineatus]